MFRLQTNVSFKLVHQRSAFKGLACGAKLCAHARLITHVQSPLSRYSLLQFQVAGVLFVCNKSASKLVARKHHFFGLACGALMRASALFSPPSRYSCHEFNLPHRTSIVLVSAVLLKSGLRPVPAVRVGMCVGMLRFCFL